MGISPVLVVADLSRSLGFYRRLGLSTLVETATYARLGWAGSSISPWLATPPPTAPASALRVPDRGTGISPAALIVIEVADGEDYCAGITDARGRAARAAGRPRLGRGVRAFLSDPDGHLEINQPTVPAAPH